MARYKLTLEYDGTRYSGWQAQKGVRSIQGTIQQAIAEGVAEKFELYGAGRTDAGVHAIEQVAHLDIPTRQDERTILYSINDRLPSDISIIEVEKAAPNFHARHDAIARSYLYVVSKRRTAFGKPYVWWIKDELDFESMTLLADNLCGLRDFKAFTDDDPEEKSTKVDLQWIDMYEAGDMILFHVVGSHFLWKMVRRLVGVLVERGRGRLALKEDALLFDMDKSKISPFTAPPSGLYLEKIYYPGEELMRGDDAFKLPFVVV